MSAAVGSDFWLSKGECSTRFFAADYRFLFALICKNELRT